MSHRLSILNAEPSRLNGPYLLHELIKHESDDIAIESYDADKNVVKITYRDFEHRAELLAKRIRMAMPNRCKGRSAQTIIPLLLPQQAELYIAQLAILKAGAAFCPLPLDAPEDRIRFILQDVAAAITLTSTKFRSRIPNIDGVEVLSIDDLPQMESELDVCQSATTNELAYVMYTSGSTGLPKGVLLSHAAVTQALLAHDRHIPAYCRLLQVAAPTFDVSVFEIFFTFFRGQTLVACDRTQLLADLPGTINSLQIDAIELTPSVASNLLGPADGVPGLKVLLTIGEMLKKDVVEEFGGSSIRRSRLHGMYGPTEAAIHCTLQPSFSADSVVNNIGIPLDTVSAFVIAPSLDEQASETLPVILPYGAEGELVVGGHQLADGYLNREEQTDAVFIEHPKYGRLYRTGDKARFVDGERIECLGRITGGQVKLRGQRLELGEVEYAVCKTSGCTGAVAEVILGSLVVFCRCDPDNVSQEDIRLTCKRWLPAYMVPADVLLRDELPYLSSGKIDRRKLRQEFESARHPDESQEIVSGSELEQQVITAVQNVIGPEAVKGDDLRLVSIDSLTSIRLASALGKIGNAQPMATHIMEARTIDDLVHSLQDSTGRKAKAMKEVSDLLISSRLEQAMLDPLLSAKRLEIADILPCSAVQSAMLAATASCPQHYCNWIELGVDSRWQVNEIMAILETLVIQHPLLRGGFLNVPGTGGGFTSVIWKPGSHNWITVVSELDHHFSLVTKDDFLHASRFQLSCSMGHNRILLQIHHALYDQWSMDVLMRDFDSMLAGEVIESTSFAEVIREYVRDLESAVSAKSISFWRNQVTNIQSLAFPNLTSVRTRSEQKTTAWRVLNTPLHDLRARAIQYSCSVQSIVQVAYAFLLSFLHGTTDICYGIVLAGRHLPIPGIEGIFGPCLTTLPVRFDLDKWSTWEVATRAVHGQNRDVLQHSDTPLSQIKALSALAHDETLFDTLFLWQESTINPAGPRSIRELASSDHHEFKLALECRPTANSVEARLTYDTALIPTKQTEIMLLQLEATVDAMLRNMAEGISLPEQYLPVPLMSISNPMPIEEARDLDLARTLIESGAKHGHRDAITIARTLTDDGADMRTISYQELHEESNQLSRRLIALDVKEDDCVCICMEKSIEFYIAILAVIKAGAGYLPLVPEIKTDRAVAILGQVEVEVILTDDKGCDHFTNCKAMVLQPSQWKHNRYSTEPLDITTSNASAAYTVFTSGSTGIPKGVVVTRGNLLSNILALQCLYEAKAEDRLLQACLQSFDVAVFEIFFSFLTGMTICTAVKDVLFDDLERSIRAFRATHLSMTPSVATLVHPDNVPSVRFLVTAGEAMTSAVHSQWAGRGLHQGYGPSETTNICSVNMKISPQHHLGSIGPPLDNTSAFVIDPGGQPKILPQGAFGELAFGGEQVFRGYLGHDDLNKDKIWQHPQYGRLYRSGDLGRILADGTMLIHGRSDLQVKIRGNRVELGEISSVVQRQDFVADCVTIIDVTESMQPTLLSFWTMKSSSVRAEMVEMSDHILDGHKRIVRALEDFLPEYMLPSLIIPLTTLPRTEQGKMDLRRLKSLAGSLTAEQRKYVIRQNSSADENVPISPFEDAIRQSIAEVINLSPSELDRNAPFETLGLTSISAVYLAKSLQTSINKRVAMSTIARQSSIARLARAITEPEEQKSVAFDQTLHVFDSCFIEALQARFANSDQQIDTVLPCTPLQEALLVASLEHGSAYCNSSTFAVRGDIQRIRRCFEQAVERHSILRTIFVETEQADKPFAQVVLRHKQLPWVISSLPQQKSGSPPTDLSHTQPICFEISHTGEQPEVTVHMHHATYDASSMAILLDEIQAMYHGEQLQPPPKANDFLLACLRQSGVEAREFWTEKLHNFSPNPFPCKGECPASEQQTLRLLGVPMTGIQTCCAKHSVSVSAFCQAAWVTCLAIMQQTEDVCFGSVVSGRMPEIPEVDRLMLPCFNTIPIRVNISRSKTYGELVQDISRAQTRASPYQLAPLRMLQRLSKDPSLKLFDSLLIVQAPQYELDERIWWRTKETGAMGFPIVLEVTPDNQNHLTLRLTYKTDYVDPQTADAIATLFDNTLDLLLHRPAEVITGDRTGGNLVGALQPVHQDLQRVLTDRNDDWSPEERIVADVLCKLARTDVSDVKSSTTIYELGLDSLNAAQIAAQLRERGFTVDVADVMEHRSPDRIAKLMQTRTVPTRDAARLDLLEFDKEHRHDLLHRLSLSDNTVEAVRPCTPVQLGLLAQSVATDGKLYVNHLHFDLPQGTKLSALEHALSCVQRKHPLLRTLFARSEDHSISFVMVMLSADSAVLPGDLRLAKFRPEDTLSIAGQIVKSEGKPLWRARVGTNDGKEELILSLHHALYDATSLQLLQHDLALSLDSVDLGEVYSLDEMIVDNSTQSDYQNISQAFWHDTLEHIGITPFPMMTARQVKDRHIKACSQSCHLTRSEVETLCKDRGCTVQAVGQAAWAYLLSAYVGEPDVVFGTVLSTRIPSSDRKIFPGMNTLPVVARNANAAADLLSQMDRFNTQLQRHRLSHLSDIQRYAGRPGSALFDTVFVFQLAPEGSGQALPITRQSSAVEYKVSIELQYTDTSQLSITLSYLSSILDSNHATLLLAQFETTFVNLLEARTDLTTTSVTDLLAISQPAYSSLPSPVSLLHEFVPLSASRSPDACAIEFINDLHESRDVRRSWTFSELARISNQLARTLQRQGAQPGSVTAVCMQKCPEASFCFQAILQTGCAFLAIDPDLPKARKEFILEDSEAILLLVDAETCTDDLETHATIMTISLDAIETGTGGTFDPVEIDPQSACYCLYTSGTTGTPKGCEISHENAVQAMMSFQRLFDGHWTASSRWLQFASYWFDVSVLEHFWSWSVGITMVGAPRDVVLSDLVHFINQAHITHIDLTPSLARLLDPIDVPCLCKGVFITGGEALKQDIIQKWGEHHVICNGYGPTEATIGVTMNPFLGTDARPTNIGPPFANVGSYVLDTETDRPVFRGAIGELCVAGKLVGKGYLKRPELTLKAFPTLASLGERIYRTGDLVRQLADNSFLFVGRKDSQAKLRGQRLELDEVDEVIKAAISPGDQVTSLVVKSEDGTRQTLVSFIALCARSGKDLRITLERSSRDSTNKAMKACKDTLPGYMVPTAIVTLSHIPLTVNNKIDLKTLSSFYNQLPAQALLGFDDKSDDVLDGNGRRVAGIVTQMLSLDPAKVNGSSNLFALGLSSVSVITMVDKLRHAGFETVDVGTIMRTPQLGRLSKILAQADRHGSLSSSASQQATLSIAACDRKYRRRVAAALEIDLEQIEAVAPCTPLQSGLIVDSVQNTQHPYFNTFSFRGGDLDQSRLGHAVQVLVHSVQILRSRFIETDDGYIQAIAREMQTPLRFTKCSTNALDAHLHDMKKSWIKANQDNLYWPFAVLVTASETSTILTLHLHHAIYDGTSLRLLIEALACLYRNETADFGPDFTAALAHGPLQTVNESEEFWKRTLKDMSFCPLHDAGSGAREDHTATITRQFSTGLQSLEALRKTLGITHQALVQSAFQVALRQVYPQCRSMGLVTSGRSMSFEGAEKIIGPLFNTLPIPITIKEEDTWEDLLIRCHEYNIDALQHQFSPLRNIKRWCGRSADEDLFDVLLVFELRVDKPTSTIDFGQVMDSEPTAEFAIAFDAVLDATGNLNVSIVAQEGAADARKLEQLSQCFLYALANVAEQSSALISVSFAEAAQSSVSQLSAVKHNYHHLNGVIDFSWTEDAQHIRQELAQVACTTTEQVDEHSTLFGLGLDSIDAVRLSSRLKRKDINITVSAIIKAQTVPRMLQSLTSRRPKDEFGQLLMFKRLQKHLYSELELPPKIDRSTVECIQPATPSQEGLFTLMQESELTNYFNHDLLELHPTIDVDRLKNSWQIVCDKHAILRTIFVQVSDPDIQCTYAQVVQRPQKLVFHETCLRDRSELDELMSKIRREVANRLEDSPAFRLTLVVLEEKWHLLLSLAHALYDGHSLSLLHEDVSGAYHGLDIDRPPPDAFIDGALQAVTAEATRFWQDSLYGAKACHLAVCNGNGKDVANRSECAASISLDDARRVCREHGVSMQALGQMCWSLTLAHYTQTLEVVFGTVLACRDSAEAERVVFPTMNTVVVRAALHGRRSDMLQDVQNFAAEMLPFKQTPLRIIQAAYGQSIGKQSSKSLFNSLFVYQQRPHNEAASEPLYHSNTSSASIEYPVAVEMEIVEQAIVLRIAAHDTLFSAAHAKVLLGHFDHILKSVVSSPELPSVHIEGQRASICGLSRFSIGVISHSQPRTNNSPPAEAPNILDGPYRDIVDVLSRVSGVQIKDIKPQMTLESLGIDSVAAIKVNALLRKRQIRTTVSNLRKATSISTIQLAAPTLDETHATLQPNDDDFRDSTAHEKAQSPQQEDLERAGFASDNIAVLMPATGGQTYMLGVWRMSKGRLFYPTFQYYVESTCSEDDLQSAWQHLVDQHDILRTVFWSTKDKATPLLQLVLKSVTSTVHFGKEWSMSALAQPFVALRAERGDSGWNLSMQIHHALYDAISLPRMMQDLARLFSKDMLPQQTVSFEEYVAETTSSSARASREAFWSDYLSNASPGRLTSGLQAKPTSRVQVYKPAFVNGIVRLEHVARNQHVGVQSLLFAIWAKIYARFASLVNPLEKMSDAVLGLYMSNRGNLEDTLELRAPTVNLVPLLVRDAIQRPVHELAKDIHRDLKRIGDSSNSAVALWEVFEWTGVEVDTFVNFLRLPEADEDVKNRFSSIIENLDQYEEEERTEVVSIRAANDFRPPQELQSMPRWRESYKESLDLELRVAGDSLDVGIFVVEELATLQDVAGMLEDLKSELQNLTASGIT